MLSSSMIPVLQRNPRYVVAVLILCVLAYVFFLQHDVDHHEDYPKATLPGDSELSAIIARSERMYKKVLERRQELIKRHGPEPAQVVMFPPDQDPWPAYTAWDFFPPAFDCPHEVERIGALGDGGKWICGLSRLAQKKDCVIYSFGLDWDSSWEAEILSRTKDCEIWGYDYVQDHFGSHITGELKPRTHFAQLQLGPKDSHGPDDTPKIHTLQTLMRQNGHTYIDILKIDIEGWEFETLKALINSFLDSDTPLPFGQLQIEVHAWGKRFHDFLKWWEMLEAAGLRPFMSEPNLVYVNYNRQSGAELADYSFLNIKGENAFITDHVHSNHEPNVHQIRHGPRE